jgi:hypothetical protein
MCRVLREEAAIYTGSISDGIDDLCAGENDGAACDFEALLSGLAETIRKDTATLHASQPNGLNSIFLGLRD